MEEEYGKTLQKLSRSTAEMYAVNDGKAGCGTNFRPFQYMHTNSCNISRTFVNAWQATLRVHELMAENRLRFAQRLNEMGDELANLAKEVDKNRKQVSIVLCPSDRGYFTESE